MSVGGVLFDVPYFSQWESPELVGEIVNGRMNPADDPRWPQSGASTGEEYAWWAGKLCGVACLRMVIQYWTQLRPLPSVVLARELVQYGGYVHRSNGRVDGLLYEPFARYTRERWRLSAQSRPALPAEEIPGHLDAGRLIMLSVNRTIRTWDPEPPEKGGHLVLAIGYRDDAVIIHNPSGLPGQSQACVPVSWEDLDRFYATRGVLLSGRQGDTFAL